MKRCGTSVDTDGADRVDSPTNRDERPSVAKKVIGSIVAALLIFMAQRDLRNRPSELIRGRVGVWKAVAMVPPGAVAYLILGRRRAESEVNDRPPESLAA